MSEIGLGSGLVESGSIAARRKITMPGLPVATPHCGPQRAGELVLAGGARELVDGARLVRCGRALG